MTTQLSPPRDQRLREHEDQVTGRARVTLRRWTKSASGRPTRHRGRPAQTPSAWTRPTLNAVPPSHRPTGPRRAPFVLLVAGLLIGGLCLLLALNTASAAAELRRHALVQSNASLQAAVQQATSQLAGEQAPAALAGAAAKLGMVANGRPGYVTVHGDGTVTVLGSPAPATSPPPPAPATATSPRPTPSPTPGTGSRSPRAPGRKTSTAAPRTTTPAPTSSTPLPGGPR